MTWVTLYVLTSHPSLPVHDAEREPGVPVQRGAGVRRGPRERQGLRGRHPLLRGEGHPGRPRRHTGAKLSYLFALIQNLVECCQINENGRWALNLKSKTSIHLVASN